MKYCLRNIALRDDTSLPLSTNWQILTYYSSACLVIDRDIIDCALEKNLHMFNKALKEVLSQPFLKYQ